MADRSILWLLELVPKRVEQFQEIMIQSDCFHSVEIMMAELQPLGDNMNDATCPTQAIERMRNGRSSNR